MLEKCPKRGGEGGIIANPIKFIANLRKLTYTYKKKRNVISKKGRGGGGVKAVWAFSKKTSIFGETVTPNKVVGKCDNNNAQIEETFLTDTVLTAGCTS